MPLFENVSSREHLKSLELLFAAEAGPSTAGTGPTQQLEPPRHTALDRMVESAENVGYLGYKLTYPSTSQRWLDMGVLGNHEDELELHRFQKRWRGMVWGAVMCAEVGTKGPLPIGSAVAVTPIVVCDGSRKQLWATALHLATKSRDTPWFSLATSPRLSKPPSLPLVPIELRKLVTTVPPDAVDNEQELGLFSPFTPERRMRAGDSRPTGMDDNDADVLFFEVNYEEAGEAFDKCPTPCFPSDRVPKRGDFITIAGYYDRPPEDWMVHSLAKQRDWEVQKRKLIAERADAGMSEEERNRFWAQKFVDLRIDDDEALSRWRTLEGTGIHPRDATVSPGSVETFGGGVIAHSASCLPGYSGAAGVMTATPTELVGLHVQSQIHPARSWGYLTSVQHKVFVYGYGLHVVPYLTLASADEINANDPEALERLHKYLASHKQFLDRAKLGDTLDAFWKKHPPPS